MAIRLLIALLLSGLIGFEREMNNHSAGFRTHILVGVGSCLMMLMSLYGFSSLIDTYGNIRFDPARIPSYVISGIGFLGAGTIIVYGGTIRGLTTAASIWTVAGLGLVVGLGMYGAAILATLIILISLVFLNNFEKLFQSRRSFSSVNITIDHNTNLSLLVNLFEQFDVKILSIEITNIEKKMRNVQIKVERNKRIDKINLYDELSRLTGVRNIS
ncbi:MgtC/SapB family protein [Bacilli bacterium]|nr:MgtC/SapB family protein [Bacilli bacterium]PZD87541.1 MgtC/SapB family protein [Bacilli bacterium]PZD90869.1 MgtC/SapB family protein [Bacilli bacterium]RCO04615.1 MgtC/SapB family protein [Bacilli bacterium]RCO09159.1 MgtC/SapB family protein [Bacilli bacterium]